MLDVGHVLVKLRKLFINALSIVCITTIYSEQLTISSLFYMSLFLHRGSLKCGFRKRFEWVKLIRQLMWLNASDCISYLFLHIPNLWATVSPLPVASWSFKMDHKAITVWWHHSVSEAMTKKERQCINSVKLHSGNCLISSSALWVKSVYSSKGQIHWLNKSSINKSLSQRSL